MDEAIEACLEDARTSSHFAGWRDKNIIDNINHGLPQYIQQHPRLRDLNEIRVLMSLGLYHFKLTDMLLENGYRAKTIVPIEGFSPSQELAYRIHAGQEVDRRLLVETALSKFLSPVLSHKSSTKLGMIISQIAEATDEELIVKIINEYQTHGLQPVINFAKLAVETLDINDPDLKVELPDNTPLLKN